MARALRFVPPILLLIGGVVLWQVAAAAQGVPDWLVPRPTTIWQATVDEHDLLLQNTPPTLEIAVLGFALALALGLLLAIAMRFSGLLELALLPLLIGSQSVPLIALAPILVVVLGYTILPKLVMVCLVCFFPVVVNAADGFRSVDPDLVNLMRSMGASRWRLFRDVELPTALPYIFSGAKVAATFAVVGAIVGEWMGSSEGLGYLMTQKQAQFDTAVIFSAMIVLTAVGVGLFGLVAAAERLLMPWYHTEQRQRAARNNQRRWLRGRTEP